LILLDFTRGHGGELAAAEARVAIYESMRAGEQLSV
jgi:hypothetical protein